MKHEEHEDVYPRWKIFLPAILVTAFFLAWWCCIIARGAEIVGPETVSAGRMATFESDTQGDCVIYPAKNIDIAKDSDKKKVYFCSTEPGEYVILFFSVVNSQPTITQKAFIVEGATPSPEPEPEPEPTPEPDSIAGAVKAGVAAMDGSTKNAEIEAMKGVLSEVTSAIDAGDIRTVPGARGAFRRLWRERASAVSEESELRWRSVLDAVSAKMDFSTLATVKAGFEEMRGAL
ncbi:MAG: hypothetical protein Q4D38_14450 [Planctomycetia bacterium]|nr:hypothetical protein [Planctomycetia bacterium]